MAEPSSSPTPNGPEPVHDGLTIHEPTYPLGFVPVPIVSTVPPPIPPASEADLAALRDEVSAWMAGASKQLVSLTNAFNSLQDTFVSVAEAYQRHTHMLDYGTARLPQMDWDGSVVPNTPGQPPGLPFMLVAYDSRNTSKPQV
jgi:hypothetical protein